MHSKVMGNSLLVALLAAALPAGAAAPVAVAPVAVGPASAPAETLAPSRSDQLTAARSDATASLLRTISAEHITPELSVEAFLQRTSGRRRLRDALGAAQQVGGARWVDGQTCQVRLEIEGARVASVLADIAADEKSRTPISADALAERLAPWKGRSFSATGSSTSALDIEQARPGGYGDGWSRISDETRRSMLRSARSDAVRRALISIENIELSAGRQIGDALKDAAVRRDVEAWLSQRPVTQIDFREDRQVEVSMSAAPDELGAALRESLQAHGQAAPDEQALDRIAQQIATRLGGSGIITGEAGVPVELPGSVPAARVALPALPPDWVNDQLDAEGTAAAAGTHLKTARAAEADALSRLAVQVEALPLTAQMTVGQAAERDPSIRCALDKSLCRAKTFKVDYQSDGSVKVKVAINLRDVWDSIAATP